MRIERECQTRRMETSETKTIQVVLNGEPRSVPAGLTVDRLLLFLQMDPSRVAVELNRTIVRKPDWPSVEVHQGAQLEVVWFVGGG
jgi:sulfur carrier protein